MIRLMRALRDALVIQRSGLLQDLHYRSQFVQGLGIDRVLLRLWPALHYVLVGAATNKNPNAYFDTETYSRASAPTGENPLSHYVRSGARSGRPAGPRFDTRYYVERHPEVERSETNPLRHFLDRGPAERPSATLLDEQLVPLESPHAASRADGRRWLHHGLGPEGTPAGAEIASSPPAEQLPFLQFHWDKGGWNNIRMQIEVMVGLAALYDRALVLPEPAEWYLIPGTETHLFDFYDEGTFRQQVPTHDTPPLSTDVWSVPTHLSVLQTIRIARQSFAEQAHREGWSFPRSTRMFGCLAGTFGSDPEIYRLVHRALRLRPDVLDLACSVLATHDLAPGGYLAAHIRRGDFQYPPLRHLDNEAIVDALKHHGADVAGKLLIVSDAHDPDLLEACRRAGWDTVCWAESSTVDPKFDGIVDMLSCCLAWRFVGTALSTFSTGIMQWRGYVSRVESAHVDATPRFTHEVDPSPWWATVDPHAWLVV